MVNVIVLWQMACTQAALEHLAAGGYPLDPAGVARLTPLGHPTINLDGRVPDHQPATATRLRILYRSSSQAQISDRHAKLGGQMLRRSSHHALASSRSAFASWTARRLPPSQDATYPARLRGALSTAPG
jgi:hypothetical protein